MIKTRQLLLLLLFLSNWSLAADFNSGRADVRINISATIVAPVCTVLGNNNQSPLFVNFDNIDFSDVESGTAYQDIQLKYNCAGSSVPANKVMSLYLYPTKYGIYTQVGNNVLRTSKEGLGISLTKENTNLDLNKWIPFGSNELEGSFILRASLITPDKSLLTEGSFDSTVAILMSYL
ncbi:TPA: fimbrial protein [Providencia stuartii]|uniref:Fimbrial protein n=3 Tax=Providencia stuartii TaxID=588 RepID=A0AAJ1N9H3_PROST|nr:MULTISPECIES: fimbrial protein [Providencia]SST03627.1 putative minor fimbrial subunit StfF [Acinetobacter baumannii]AFH93381.1 fimbrial subunit [Providencia stuartii MRSN 2154]AIN66037.1 fimbrial family protein [Providencia stuartii]AMG68240.1 fimbrial protein [Providencia stuartii]APG51376.1 fimbrial protein [Providencia stuartii]